MTDLGEFSNDEIRAEIVGRLGNYAAKFLDMVAAGQLPLGTELTQVDIFHDPWCGVYGGKKCNCDPNIEVR